MITYKPAMKTNHSDGTSAHLAILEPLQVEKLQMENKELRRVLVQVSDFFEELDLGEDAFTQREFRKMLDRIYRVLGG